MIIPFTLMFGVAGYYFYKSKKEVSLIEVDKLERSKKQHEEDDLYEDLEDLFI